jgi:hypothetical protein
MIPNENSVTISHHDTGTIYTDSSLRSHDGMDESFVGSLSEALVIFLKQL